jgi:uncharacterized membrane protein YGL010W
MRSLPEHLASYAAYHRDRRNIATHFVGIPMIVVAVAVLLARPILFLGALPLSLATLVTLLATLYYLRLDVRFGMVMALLLGASLVFAQWAAAQSTMYWLATGISLFVVGWVIQFVGHAYEGRKPAFVDDLAGLIIGPLFVVAEAAFLMGLRRDLEGVIIAAAGPTRSGQRKAIEAR